MPATGVPVRMGELFWVVGMRPCALCRAFSSVAKQKKLALWVYVMSRPSSPSLTRSSTIGGGSTGRRSDEAVAKE